MQENDKVQHPGAKKSYKNCDGDALHFMLLGYSEFRRSTRARGAYISGKNLPLAAKLPRPSGFIFQLPIHRPGGLAWVYKTSARKVDKHPTLNSAPASSVIKKKGPGLGPWAWSRARPSPARTSYWHGSTRLAWVYNTIRLPPDGPPGEVNSNFGSNLGRFGSGRDSNGRGASVGFIWAEFQLKRSHDDPLRDQNHV